MRFLACSAQVDVYQVIMLNFLLNLLFPGRHHLLRKASSVCLPHTSPRDSLNGVLGQQLMRAALRCAAMIYHNTRRVRGRPRAHTQAGSVHGPGAGTQSGCKSTPETSPEHTCPNPCTRYLWALTWTPDCR